MRAKLKTFPAILTSLGNAASSNWVIGPWSCVRKEDFIPEWGRELCHNLLPNLAAHISFGAIILKHKNTLPRKFIVLLRHNQIQSLLSVTQTWRENGGLKITGSL